MTNTTLSPGTVRVNETATVTARIKNGGRATGTRTVALTLNGTVVAERTVTLAPGNATTLQFSLTPEAGEYAVDVESTTVGTLQVVAADPTQTGGTTSSTRTEMTTPSPTDTAQTSTAKPVAEPSGLGLQTLGGLVFVLALLATVLALIRRAPWR
ncbi:CARDB domain-containing protein [Halospeciosus flavus]|uniref:CARDB domain-containing protein n=1 Tax=Halospeciosus flavus TaxID=3032283 RepID=A0ABD5Z218_9EURY|nr:CARDB domain-containing protein [Halospeciosus flavus]